MKNRWNAKVVKKQGDYNALFPYMMKRRCDSAVYYSTYINLEKLLPYLAAKKKEGNPITIFQTVLIALTRTSLERPHLNRFVMGRRLYQRDAVDIGFTAKRALSDEGEETSVNLHFTKQNTNDEIIEKITHQIRSAKAGEIKDDDKLISFLVRLPRFMLRAVVFILERLDFYSIMPTALEKIDPLRCSVYVSNLGSIGIDAPYHHLYEWGTCSVFAAIGKIKNMPVCLDDGSIVSKPCVGIKFTLDERIADGFYMARSLDLFKDYMENPEILFHERSVAHEQAVAKVL